jgi:hypothetical protein
LSRTVRIEHSTEVVGIMDRKPACLSSGLMAVACIGTAIVFASVPSRAETITNEGPRPTDPLMELASMYQPRDQFSLYSENDADLVRFKQDHLISICVPHENRDQIGATSHAVGLVVKFDGDSDTILPGSCLSLEAKRITVKPDGPVGQNNVLTGTIRLIR